MKLLLVCVLGILGLAVHHTSAGALLDRHVRDTENTPQNVQAFQACIATVGSDKTAQKVCLDVYLSSIENKKECCEIDGKRQCGQSQYRSGDGCNQCSCQNGRIYCTKMLCIAVPDCKVKGTEYYAGQPIVGEVGGCDKCFCGYDGNIHCDCNPSCDLEFACTDEWDPVCKDQVKYTNECRFREAKCLNAEMDDNLKSHPCPQPNFCKERFYCFALFDPVCGSDGKVYSNKCNLMVARCIYGDPSLHVDRQWKDCPEEMKPEPKPINILT